MLGCFLTDFGMIFRGCVEGRLDDFEMDVLDINRICLDRSLLGINFSIQHTVDGKQKSPQVDFWL